MPVRSIYESATSRNITGGVPADQSVRAQNATPTSVAVVAPPIETVWRECQALTNAGQPCQASPAKGTKYCIGHLRKYHPEQIGE